MSLTFRCFALVLIVATECAGLAQTALSLRGCVLDSTGAGISGATVRLETVTGALLYQSQTASKGEFILTNLPSGNFSLVVPAYAGFGSRTVAVRLATSLTGIKVTLAAQSVNQEI